MRNFDIAIVYGGQRDDTLARLAVQMGVTSVVGGGGGGGPEGQSGGYIMPWDYHSLAKRKKAIEDMGMTFDVIEGIGFIDKCKLGKPGRNEEIDIFCKFLENMGKLNIPVVCYNWMPIFGWFRTNVQEKARGGALATGFHMSDVADWPDVAAYGKLTKQELWDNLEYFLKRVVPVAEKYRVKLALHPDDPPVDCIAGIERILTTADAMMQVTQIVKSDFNGITLCQGCFSSMSEDIPKEIRRFGKAGKLFFSHFRDVVGDCNDFVEVFHDEGKTDMYQAMKAYYDIDYHGVTRPDHVPTMYGEENASPGYTMLGNLFAIGYMKGLIDSIEAQK